MRTLTLKTDDKPVVEILPPRTGNYCDFCGEIGKSFVRGMTESRKEEPVDICMDCATQIVQFFEENVEIPDQAVAETPF